MLKKAIEVQPPNNFEYKSGYRTIFLGGSIGLPDSGSSENWQRKMIEDLSDKEFIFLNPRRNDWNESLEQTIENDLFREQVSWELYCLEIADKIVMYFDPNTKAPISLLELGLHAKSGRLIVFCPEGFWRKGNVDIVCQTYGIKQVKTYDELIKTINEY